jgi:hypothetical protein
LTPTISKKTTQEGHYYMKYANRSGTGSLSWIFWQREPLASYN